MLSSDDEKVVEEEEDGEVLIELEHSMELQEAWLLLAKWQEVGSEAGEE